MLSSKLKELNLLKFFVTSLFAFGAFSLGLKVGAQETTTAFQAIQVTLTGINAFSDFQEIQSALSKMENVEKLTRESEAPGLLILSMKYFGDSKNLVEKLNTVFLKKYAITEKGLPSGGKEISLSKNP